MWIITIIFSALFDSLKILLGKKWSEKISLSTIIWAQWFFALFLLVPIFLILKPAPPDSFFWGILFLSTSLNAVATAMYWKGVMLANMSLVLPVASITPIFLLITSPVITGEVPNTFGIMGVIIAVIGAYILNLDKRVIGFWEPLKSLFYQKGLRYVFVVAILWSITSNLDKIAITHSSPIVYITYLHILMAVIFLPAIIYKRRYANIFSNTSKLLTIGLASGLSLILQMYAYLGAIVPYVISVKRTNILFGVVLGALVLKEKQFRERFIGGLIIIIGIVIIIILG